MKNEKDFGLEKNYLRSINDIFLKVEKVEYSQTKLERNYLKCVWAKTILLGKEMM